MNFTRHSDLEASHKLNAVQKQSDIKECILYESICLKLKSGQSLSSSDRAQNSGYLWGEYVVTEMEHKWNFGERVYSVS